MSLSRNRLLYLQHWKSRDRWLVTPLTQYRVQKKAFYFRKSTILRRPYKLTPWVSWVNVCITARISRHVRSLLSSSRKTSDWWSFSLIQEGLIAFSEVWMHSHFGQRNQIDVLFRSLFRRDASRSGRILQNCDVVVYWSRNFKMVIVHTNPFISLALLTTSRLLCDR